MRLLSFGAIGVLFIVFSIIVNYYSFFDFPVQLQDWRDKSNICPVHLIKMREEIVHGLKGFVDPSLEYMKVSDSCPNHGIDFDRDMYSEEMGIIYVCPQCLLNFKNWQSSRR
jgi:hypothetical protein